MLSLLPLVVALASDPDPARTAAPRPTPLQEIGRVRALPACTPIVVHANGAITPALDNDRALAILTNNLRDDRLRQAQRDPAPQHIERSRSRPQRSASTPAAADGEIKSLREYAVGSPTRSARPSSRPSPTRWAARCCRQKRAANELMRDIAIIQGRGDAAEARGIMRPRQPDARERDRAAARHTPGVPGAADSWNDTMRAIAEQPGRARPRRSSPTRAWRPTTASPRPRAVDDLSRFAAVPAAVRSAVMFRAFSLAAAARCVPAGRAR